MKALTTFTVLAGWLCLALADPAPAQEPEARYRGKTVRAWKAVLKHADERERLSAALALGEAGRDALPALAELTAVLKDRSALVRRASAQALAGLGAAAAAAAPNLARNLRDADPLVRQLAAQALAEMGDAAVPPLLAVLKDTDPSVRISAVMTLDALGARGAETVSALTKTATRDASALLRRLAVAALAKMGADAADAVPTLIPLLRDKDSTLRSAAALALVKVGKSSIPALVKMLDDKAAEARLTAIQALSCFNADDMDEAAVTALVKSLADEEARIRLLAAGDVAALGLKARELGGGRAVIVMLLKMLKDNEAKVRRTAVLALGQVGLDEKEDITALAGALQDREVSVRAMAVSALAQYSHDQAPDDWRRHVMTCVAEGLKDTDRRVQLAAAKTLAGEGKFSVPGLIQVLEQTQGSARLLAAATLGDIGTDARDAAPALEKMSKEALTADARKAAAAALGKIQN